MDKKTFANDEFIGLQVKIKECKDPSWIGKTGLIIDETKNMFTVMNKTRKIKVSKKKIKLQLTLPNQHKVTLDGQKLMKRPEDRIKMFRRNQRLVT